MKAFTFPRILSTGLLLIALVLLAIGARRAYPVYPADTGQPPPPIFIESNMGGSQFVPPGIVVPPIRVPPEPVPMRDWQLVRNATFTGVTRRDGRLCLTYDPSQNRGKRSCPT